MSPLPLPAKLVLSRQILDMERISPTLSDFGRQVRNAINDLNDAISAQAKTAATAAAPASGSITFPPGAVSSQTTAVLGADVTLVANTPTTLLSLSVTMPSGPGTFRAIVCYGIAIVGGGVTVDAIVTDGTNTFASSQTGLPGSDITGQNASAPSPVTYGPGQAVTFTLQVESNGTPTIKASPLLAGQGTWMSVLILTD